jgi:hypothetical protein
MDPLTIFIIADGISLLILVGLVIYWRRVLKDE